MTHIPILRYVSIVVSFSILFMILFPATPTRSFSPPSTKIIDFETLNAPGNGTGGLQMRNQFAESGIIFHQPVTALDYSQGVPIPNFAHSGTKAIELCYAQEFCTAQLDLSFPTTPQRRIKLWTGFTSRLDSQQAVVMCAFDGNGNEVAADIKILGPSTGAIPISIPLEVMLPSATIVRVRVGFLGAQSTAPQIFNNGLAFDDIEFDDQGLAPQCPATQAPLFTVNEPTEGRIVLQNAFTLDANLTTPDPFATLQVNIAGPGGATQSFGPVFIASGHVSFFNLSGLLFPGRNIVTFIVRDCAGSKTVRRTVFFRNDVTRTTIRVINENGTNAPGAEVYANGSLIGRTDPFGNLVVTPALNAGTELITRKFVTESATYRSDHSKGSNQNWKYRVYITNMAINNDGSSKGDAVKVEPDPFAPQVLRVLRRNALFGLHLVASFEWDASAEEMETVREKLFVASKFLYNATDGQMVIEQVEVVDDAKYWGSVDMRIQANQSLTAFVEDPLPGFIRPLTFPNLPFVFTVSRMHVRFSDPAGVYPHEFGHYGFGAKDEYKIGDPSVHCTALLTSDDPRFKNGSPSASCMMFSPSAAKLCSSRSENRHVKGTRQGDSSCWSTLAPNFRDSNSTQRWIVQTPDTRGAIPGPVNGANLPSSAWRTKITFENGTRPNLCLPIAIKALRSDGTPDVGREIRLATTYGANILQGKTDPNGNLTVTGVHVGDRIEGLKIQTVNCTATARLGPSRIGMPKTVSLVAAVSQEGFPQSSDNPQLQIVSSKPAFNIFTILKPLKGESAQIIVRLESAGKAISQLSKPPEVKVLVRGEETQYVSLRYNGEAKEYIGKLAKLPINEEIAIEVAATDRRAKIVQTIGQFQTSLLAPGYETDVMSADGQLALTIPAKALPSDARIIIGSPSAAPPALPNDYSIVAGPYSVWSFPDRELYPAATLRFQLPHDSKDSRVAAYEANALRIFQYDSRSQKWEDIGGVVHPYPIDIVAVETKRLGMFALVGRKAGQDYQRAMFSFDRFMPETGERFTALLSMGLELR
jgi:hypothetical protein